MPAFLPLMTAGLTGWVVRAFADHRQATTDIDEMEEEGLNEEIPENMENNADSVWSSITNTDGLF